MGKIDHAEFSRLFRENPAEFKRRTRQIIEEFISDIPEESRQKFRELQTIIDAEVALCDDPLEACRKIFRMMAEMYSKAGGLRDCFIAAEQAKAILKAGVEADNVEKKIKDLIQDIGE